MKLGIEGKVALVAGGSRGLGRAVAEELAAEGCRVVVCARSPEGVDEAAAALRGAHGGEILGVAADLTDPEGVEQVIQTTLSRFETIDILFTNTGGPPPGPFEAHTPEVWDQAVAQNLSSVLNLVRGTLTGMKERKWGRIINCTSVAVKQPVDGLILSNAVRAAVTGFARTLANEVAPFGITVNNVLPGFTRTERLDHLAAANAQRKGVTVDEAFSAWEADIPMGRLGEPKEFGALVAFLASARASYITGTSIPVDGGWVRGLL